MWPSDGWPFLLSWWYNRGWWWLRVLSSQRSELHGGKSRELFPLLTARVLFLKIRVKIYTYIHPVLLYASECWAPTVENGNKLQRNDRAMIRWICNGRLKRRVSSASLLERLCIADIKSEVRFNRLRWYGHVQRNEGCIRHIANM